MGTETKIIRNGALTFAVPMIVILSAAAAILLSHERAIADLRACDGEQKVEIRMLSENVNEMRIDVKELLRRIPRISENSP